MDNLEEKILARQTFEGVALKDICYGYGEEASLASVVVEELKKQHKTITAAESLTAGLFQATLADFSGVSAIFKGGFVTYSLEEKAKMLEYSTSRVGKTRSCFSLYGGKNGRAGTTKTQSDFGVSLTGGGWSG